MDSTVVKNSNQSNYHLRFLFLSILPFAILIFFLVKYRTEAPVADEWAIVPLVGKAYAGTLQLGDLLQQHNEHRQPFGRFIMISLARLSHWTMLYEALVNALLGVVIFVAALILLKRSEVAFQVNLLGAVPAISLMVFSLSQSENWFWGFNMPILMDVAGVTLGLVLLGVSKVSWLPTMSAAALGVVSTFSFANGILIWPIGLCLLWRKTVTNTYRWKLLLFWVAITVAVFWLYLDGYHKPAHSPSPFHFLNQPHVAINFLFTYLGGPLLAFCKKTPLVADWLTQHGLSVPSPFLWFANHASFFAGLAGAALLCLGYFRLRRHQKSDILLTFLALSSYSILSAALSAIGRSGWGVQSALSLRYISISTPFWLSILILLFILAKLPKIENQDSKSLTPKFSMTCITSVIILLCLNSVYGALYAVKYHNFLIPARDELLRLENSELLRRLYPYEDYIKRNVPILKRYRLSVFKDRESSIE